jgi:membrane protease YdiL (CAAX protease family)
MKLFQQLNFFILYLFLIIVAEVVTSLFTPVFGLFLHSIILLTLLMMSAFWHNEVNTSNLFLCLSIAPLIRIFSLFLPLAYFPSYTWYLIAGIPMLVAAVIIIKIQRLKLNDVGLNIKKPSVQFAIMFTGIPFGVLEYYVLTPAPIASDLSIVGFVLLAIAFIFATGFAEELVFRGILQNNAIKLFGPKVGLIAVSAVFAALHIGWLNLMDVTLVFVIGLIFGIFMYKTGSLAGVSLSHGLTNVFLFIVMPYLVNLINGLSSR